MTQHRLRGSPRGSPSRTQKLNEKISNMTPHPQSFTVFCQPWEETRCQTAKYVHEELLTEVGITFGNPALDPLFHKVWFQVRNKVLEKINK
jgi:hypothetical protein